MAGAAGGGGGGQGDNSTAILWTVAALFAFFGGVWFVFKNQIVQGFLALKLFELKIVSAITGNAYTSLRGALEAGMQSPGRLELHDIAMMGSAVGAYVRWPFVLLLIGLALVVYFFSNTRIYKQIYNMKSFAKLEATNWPFINPVIGLDLIKEDINKGRWAMAMTPMQFCKRYRLLQEVRPEEAMLGPQHRAQIEVVLKRGRCNRLFIMQLGPLWRGPDKLPPHTRALFAAFAARINADKAGTALLEQMAKTCRGKMDYKGVDELINKHYKSKEVQKVVEGHAYVLTVMYEMLMRARDDGVQASCDFLWLKPLDRRLWYTLNTVGRQTPFIEVGGIFAHWNAEREAGRRLLVPMVEEATEAVELALKDIIYTPEEEK